MIINFVGNFQSGYVGEVADQVHLAREMAKQGHTVRQIPQDEFREFVLSGSPYPNVPHDLSAHINIITKWHHFFDGSFITTLKKLSNAPVLYWVWDYMWDQGIPSWHLDAINACDLYLGNDVHCGYYPDELKKKLYYFPFDVADGSINRYLTAPKLFDVVFFGSCIGQGNRIPWLMEINKYHPVKIFSWNYEQWINLGFDASPAVYGEEFAQVVAKSKIILGFSVEANCWGYWSNRVGKVLTLGGFLLYQYAPGMELFLRDGVSYFSSPAEAVDKIDHFLISDSERERIAQIGYLIGRERFTSEARIRELMILAERFLLSAKGAEWQI